MGVLRDVAVFLFGMKAHARRSTKAKNDFAALKSAESLSKTKARGSMQATQSATSSGSRLRTQAGLIFTNQTGTVQPENRLKAIFRVSHSVCGGDVRVKAGRASSAN